MARSMSVLVASHSSSRLNSIEDVFIDTDGIAFSRKLLSEKTTSLIADSTSVPDVIILDLGEQGESDLSYFSSALAGMNSTALIVIGPADKPDLMRKAMQAGARDYFMSPISEDELIASVLQMGVAAQVAKRKDQGSITVMVNGKGGAGATSMVSSLSALLASRSNNTSVAAIDMDLQYGTLPMYFDMPTRDNLMQALQTSDALDPVALSNLADKHSSGVHLLAVQPKEIRASNSVSPLQVQSLLSMLAMSHDHVVIDAPRVIDEAVGGVFELADNVVIVTQQSIPDVRDARFLMSLIRTLGVPSGRIKLLVNRFERKSDVSLRDLAETFEDIEILKVPNDHKRMRYATNNGIPVVMKWPRASISKHLVKVTETLWPVE